MIYMYVYIIICNNILALYIYSVHSEYLSARNVTRVELKLPDVLLYFLFPKCFLDFHRAHAFCFRGTS